MNLEFLKSLIRLELVKSAYLVYFGNMIKTIEWTEKGIVMIDQRLLPTEEVYNTYTTVEEVADAIVTMVIRVAPAIRVSAAMGIAQAPKPYPS